VAFVVAETRRQALDASERIEVDYAPLPAVTACDEAPQGPPVWEDVADNVSFRGEIGDAAAAAVPAEGLVFQMGVMGARDRPVMRLCTRNMDAEASLSWLARIGWPGDRTLLRRTVARLDPLCHDIALNVDILSDRVGPKLGVELYALSEADRRSLAMEPWRPLFDELLAQGLVRPDKLAVLADYPSLRMFRQYRAFRRKPPVGYPALATNLHHLKLVFAGDRAVEVKAYIGVYRPIIDYNRVGKMEIDGGDGWF